MQDFFSSTVSGICYDLKPPVTDVPSFLSINWSLQSSITDTLIPPAPLVVLLVVERQLVDVHVVAVLLLPWDRNSLIIPNNLQREKERKTTQTENSHFLRLQKSLCHFGSLSFSFVQSMAAELSGFFCYFGEVFQTRTQHGFFGKEINRVGHCGCPAPMQQKGSNLFLQPTSKDSAPISPKISRFFKSPLGQNLSGKGITSAFWAFDGHPDLGGINKAWFIEVSTPFWR